MRFDFLAHSVDFLRGHFVVGVRLYHRLRFRVLNFNRWYVFRLLGRLAQPLQNPVGTTDSEWVLAPIERVRIALLTLA